MSADGGWATDLGVEPTCSVTDQTQRIPSQERLNSQVRRPTGPPNLRAFSINRLSLEAFSCQRTAYLNNQAQELGRSNERLNQVLQVWDSWMELQVISCHTGSAR